MEFDQAIDAITGTLKEQGFGIITDINMPEMDGIEVLKALKQRNTKVKTIILSSLSDPKLVEEMIKLGANGFIDKTFANTQLISAVKVVFNGIQYISENITNKLVERYTSEVEVEEVPQFLHGDLTSRELTVLKLIAKEKSSIEIGDALNVSVKTVETHRSSLYKKLPCQTFPFNKAIYS